MNAVSQQASRLEGSLFERTGQLLRGKGTYFARMSGAIGEILKIRTSNGSLVPAEVISFDEELVQLMPFASDADFRRGDLVIASGHPLRVPAGYRMLGRVVDSVGNPIDGKGILEYDRTVDLKYAPPAPMKREDISKPFETGIRAIDSMLTIGVGQRVGIFAGSGVGKSTLLGNIALFSESEINVIALVGERGREVRPFVEDCLGREGLAKSIVIVSTSNESPLSRVRAVDSSIAVADWFRSRGRNVLLMIDSITRFATAQRELGLLTGEPPTSRGYPPSVFQRMASTMEPLGNSEQGSITGLITVLVEGDDLLDPVADAARSILDGHIVLNRGLAERHHYPAIDVPASISRLANGLMDEKQRAQAGIIRRSMAVYREVEDLIQIGAYKPGGARETDLAVACKPLIDRFLQQYSGKSAMSGTLAAMSSLADICSGRTPVRSPES